MFLSRFHQEMQLNGYSDSSCAARRMGGRNETMAVKLPTLAPQRRSSSSMARSERGRKKKTYDVVKKRLIETLMPMGFTVLDIFQTRRLQPGEALSVFSHDL